jgi:transposase InsO family protein
MPWKASTPVDLRKEFIMRLGRGERLTDLCREYGIARKTGEKFKRRFREHGLPGLQDRSRAPGVIPHKTPPELVEVIVAHRRPHPTWGPRKLKETLQTALGRVLPAASTIGDILTTAGLIAPRQPRPRHHATPTGLREAAAPNDVWCIDYKGQFRLGAGTYCYPLTITDQFSRFILCCEGMGAIADDAAREQCLEVFATHGLPTVIRSDNGVPFASTGLAGLTKLSVLWLRLGIELERTRPAHPQDNGRHERMHRTLKQETTRPARANLLQQQERFDAFVDEFNRHRPHEGLAMRPPAAVYVPSSTTCPTTLPALDYPTCDDVSRVGSTGMLHLRGRRQLYLSTALAGEYVGLREDNEIEDRWLVTFANLALGYVEPGSHHFTALPLSTPTRLAGGEA